jgi:hypothetical protein
MFQLKQLSILFVMFALLFIGCVPATTEDSVSNTQQIINQVPESLRQGDTSETVTFSVDELVISVQRPPSWESVSTDYGVVLAEKMRTMADVTYGGLLAHIFVPPLDNIVLTQDGDNVARSILRQVIASPEYINGAITTSPTAFQWHSLDAAYFLMDNRRGSATVIIGLAEPVNNKLAVIQISAPSAEAERIRMLLPQVLDRMVINNVELSGSALDAVLPTMLEFPQTD